LHEEQLVVGEPSPGDSHVLGPNRLMDALERGSSQGQAALSSIVLRVPFGDLIEQAGQRPIQQAGDLGAGQARSGG